MGWGSIRKSITKPFKQAGKAIHWTEIRTPVVAAAAVAGAVYTGGASLTALAGTGAASSMGVAGGLSAAGAAMTSGSALGYAALAGGYMGFTAEQQNRALAAQKESDAATLAAADKMAAASGTPMATQAAATQVDMAAVQANASTAARRRYSLSRTVNGSSLLGGFGASTRRATLG